MELDEARVAELAFSGSSNREIGDIIGCDEKTIANRFSGLIRKKRAERRSSLRKAQTDAALAGDRTMLVWLGKQELGQTDKARIELKDKTDEQIVDRYRTLRAPARNGAAGNHAARG